MGGLGSYARRSLAARPLRTLLTILGVALGVGVLLAALVTNAGIEGAVDRTVAGIIGRADLRVEGFSETGLSASTLGTIAAHRGCRGRGARPRAPDLPRAGPRDPPRRGAAGAGDRSRDRPRRRTGRSTTWRSSTARRSPRRSGPGALVTERLAAATGLGVGDPIVLSGADGPRSEPIIGILAGDGPLEAADGRTVLVGLGEAETLFGTGAASRVDLIRSLPARRPMRSPGALQARLTQEPYVLSGPVDLARGIRASTADFQATTALIAALALFGGAFLIFNTLSMTVAERAREVGLLRAAGATRRQVNGLVLGQALILGVAGSLLGVIAVGLGLAALVGWYVRGTGIVRIDGPRLRSAPIRRSRSRSGSW